MKGKYKIVVSAKRLRYDFEIRRNLTILIIIRGDSATGKTTLIDMSQEYVNNPSGTPVEVMKVIGSKCQVILLCDSWYPKAEVAALVEHQVRNWSANPVRYNFMQFREISRNY